MVWTICLRDPAHLGYHPNEMDDVSEEEWAEVFDNPEHRILSIYCPEAGHIGEIHLAIEESLGDGQLSILIGRKDLWHHGFGSAAARRALETAFNEYGLYASGSIYRNTIPPRAACSPTSAFSTKAHCERAVRMRARASTPW